jgi:serine/threonine-protein kinase
VPPASTSDFLKPGDMFLDYRLRRVIGEGGMGIVFEGVDERYDDVVAIKCLSPVHAARPDFVARFTQECRIYPKLKHRHIVHMRRAGVADAVPARPPHVAGRPPIAFIVMDLLEGKTLRKILNTFVRLDYLNTLLVMIQLAEGMLFAHLKNIVHRDLKPENIMVGTVGEEKGWLWIMDFGIAAAEGGVNTEEMPDMGTARYMAPEQVRNVLSAGKKGARVKLDHRVDVYAFGVIFYEVFTGRHIFIDEKDPPTFEETLFGHLHSEPKPVHKVIFDCLEAEDVWPIIEKCLAKDPDDRYQSFADVQADLQALVRSSVNPAHPLAKRARADRLDKQRQSAFAALPAGGTEPRTETPMAGSTEMTLETSGREALPPEPPTAQPACAAAPPEPEAPPPTPPPAIAEAVPAPSPASCEGTREAELAPTVPATRDVQPGPDGGERLTVTLADTFVPRGDALPFVKAAAPFVPSGPEYLLRSANRTVRMQSAPATQAPQPGKTAVLQRPTMPADPTYTGNVRAPSEPQDAASVVAHRPARALRPAGELSLPTAKEAGEPSPTEPCEATPPPPTVTRGGFWPAPALPPSVTASSARNRSHSTPSEMTLPPRTSRRSLFLAPLAGFVIVLVASVMWARTHGRGGTLTTHTSATTSAAPLPAPASSAPGAPDAETTTTPLTEPASAAVKPGSAQPIASARTTPPPPAPSFSSRLPRASARTSSPRTPVNPSSVIE